VKVSELPEDWRARLRTAADARVTVRIEEETESREVAEQEAENPLFGMWRDREELSDVEAYVRKLRAPRF
jgi:hypothetical protein